jgi:hypothetical protein
MKYDLKIDEKGKIDITGLERMCRGDTLNIDGTPQKIVDICEASVFTEVDGECIEYGIELDERDSEKTYLKLIN